MPDKNLELAKMMLQEMSACVGEYLEAKSEVNQAKEIIDPNKTQHLPHYTTKNNQKTLGTVRNFAESLRIQHQTIQKVDKDDPIMGSYMLSVVKRLSASDTGSRSLNKKLKEAVIHAEQRQAEQLDERDFSGKKTIDPL